MPQSNTRDFLLDAKGHVAVVNGDFAVVADRAAVVQGIAVRLKMFQGENWLNQAAGTPWVQTIFRRGTDPLLIREILRRQIAATPDVLEVASADLAIDPATRAAHVAYEVRDAWSTSPIAGGVPVLA